MLQGLKRPYSPGFRKSFRRNSLCMYSDNIQASQVLLRLQQTMRPLQKRKEETAKLSLFKWKPTITRGQMKKVQ